jgi:uncharacterized protein YjbI with pentapeptide repeats
MANEEHLARLKQGVEALNRRREAHPEFEANLIEADLFKVTSSGMILIGTDVIEGNPFRADLSGVNLSRMDLSGVNLFGATLSGANLSQASLVAATLCGTNLSGADLHGAKLSEANFHAAKLSGVDLTQVDLRGANLSGANLSGANLDRANLTKANLAGASLTRANLQAALLLETDFEGANLTGCSVYGIAAWNVNLVGAQQSDLVITRADEPVITVDNVEVAQFIYLLLHNEKIREVIDTITSKAVLILGRFNLPERKAVLEAIREALRRRNYLPIVFDFERPTNRDFTETIMTLAGMCLFIIADITNLKSSPLELQAPVPNYMVPFVPIIQKGEEPFAMFKDLKGKFNWVLAPLAYDSASHLISGLDKAVIRPALKKYDELLAQKTEELRIRHIEDYPDDEEDVTRMR